MADRHAPHPLTCSDCGAGFMRRSRSGPLPTRCENCRRWLGNRAARTRTKVYRAASRDARMAVAVRCLDCGAEFPRSGAKGPIPERCTACRATWIRATNAVRARRVSGDDEHPAHRAYQRRRRARALRSYGMTPAEYDRLLSVQGGLCAVCRRDEVARDRRGRIRPLAVDHDHDTGAVRGLLCANCNVAIGYMDDDADRLESAAGYLRDVARRRLHIVERKG